MSAINREASPNRRSKRWKIAAAIAAAFALLGVHVWWASHFYSGVYLVARALTPFVVLFAVMATAIGSPFAVNEVRRRKQARRRQKEQQVTTTWSSHYRTVGFSGAEWLASAIAVVVIAAAVGGATLVPYETDVTYRVQHLEFVEGSAPGFAARFPYQVANGLMGRSVGDAENVRVREASYTDPATGQWASLVSGVGALRPSLGVVIKTDSGFVRCDWPASDAGAWQTLLGNGGVGAQSGTFGNDLARQLRKVQRNTRIVWDGLGAWCTPEGPYVLIPSEKPAGILRVHKVPAGAWLIAPDGTISFEQTIAEGQYPVPTIGPTLARDMVDANLRISRDGTAAGWRSLLPSARVGLERPERASSGGTESANPDYGNAGEFLLQTVSGEWVFATPLTPVGASETIVAIAVVEAGAANAGQLPRTVIYRLPETERRRSNIEVAKMLRTAFDSDVQWEAGYEIFELAPLNDGAWSATIGQTLEVKYRVLLQADGSACLTLFDTGEQIRCSGESLRLRTVLENIDADSPSGPVSETLGEMSERELYDLLEQIARELRQRS